MTRQKKELIAKIDSFRPVALYVVNHPDEFEDAIISSISIQYADMLDELAHLRGFENFLDMDDHETFMKTIGTLRKWRI